MFLPDSLPHNHSHRVVSRTYTEYNSKSHVGNATYPHSSDRPSSDTSDCRRHEICRPADCPRRCTVDWPVNNRGRPTSSPGCETCSGCFRCCRDAGNPDRWSWDRRSDDWWFAVLRQRAMLDWLRQEGQRWLAVQQPIYINQNGVRFVVDF